MYKSGSYTGISTSSVVVHFTFKVIKFLFFCKFMFFYESSFCSSFLLVPVNLVDVRSKDRK